MNVHPARYFDGIVAGHQPASVVDEGSSVKLILPTGTQIWRTAAVESVLLPDGSLELFRPEIDEARVLLDPSPDVRALHRSVRRHRSARTGWVGRVAAMFAQLSAAVVVVLGIVFWLGPAVAERLAPFVPSDTEIALGRKSADFLADYVLRAPWCEDPEAVAALHGMLGSLELSSAAHVPIEVRILKTDVPNALALPGGMVIFTQGILAMAPGPDAIAGVLAHEVAHVAHRDGLRSFLRAAGTAGLFSVLIGDLSGGAIIAVVSDHLLSSAYSRDAEREADDFAIRHMERVGVPPENLARLFERFAERMPDQSPFASRLSSHPDMQERISAIRHGRQDSEADGFQTVDRETWSRVRTACASS